MVRIGTPGVVARPAWYDRSPSLQLKRFYGVDVAPHSATQRWTYTVPAGKKAFLEAINLKLIRKTAASTVGVAYASIVLNTYSVFEARVVTNNVGDKDAVSVGQALTLNPGDTLEGYTYDGSTGGTFDYQTIVKITEFDA